ncbi:MAG: hypothetical protein OJF51_001692 [Nitrospira sp.]|nr:MAG: hypothetical protein OJF51_001692 [Nitrospira sp.]
MLSEQAALPLGPARDEGCLPPPSSRSLLGLVSTWATGGLLNGA